MEKKGDVRGLSRGATIFLIGMIVVLIVGFFVVKNVLLKGSGERTLGKYTLELKISSVQIDSSSNSLIVLVRRNIGKGNFSGMKFVISDVNGNKEEIKSNITFVELESKSFTLALNELNVSDVEKIELYPLFRTELKEKTGDKEDEYNLKSPEKGTCVPYCPVDAECGDNGCGRECNGGCTETGYFCSNYKCLATIDTKCARTSIIIKDISNVGNNFSVRFSREGGEDVLGGVKFIFMDENASSNFVADIPGNIPTYTTITRYVEIPEDYLKEPKKIRTISYFVDDSGDSEQVCPISEIFSF